MLPFTSHVSLEVITCKQVGSFQVIEWILQTLAFSYLVGTISSYYDTKIVLMAMGISAVVCLTVSIFSMQTKVCETSLKQK